MNFLKLFLLTNIVTFTFQCELQHYNILKDKSISENHLIDHNITKPFMSDSLSCFVHCNLISTCNSVTFENSLCTLFSEELSLIHTVSKLDENIFSKKKLELCSKSNFYNETNLTCEAKKDNGKACKNTNECIDSKHFSCIDGTCQCETSK